MKLFSIGAPISTVFILLFNLNVSAQNDNLWTRFSPQDMFSTSAVQRSSVSVKAAYYQLDFDALKQRLQSAPDRKSFQGISSTVISFPGANGVLETFRVMEASVMHPDLQARHPGIRSYVGFGIDNPATLVRFSLTPHGLHAMRLNGDGGAQFIDPYSNTDNSYLVYFKKDLSNLKTDFQCEVVDGITNRSTPSGTEMQSRNANDGMLRDFRLALASTIEYSEFHWMAAGLTNMDSDADKKAAVLAAMVVTMTRVNGIYENDLSITMTLIANNEDIIFVGNTDPYNNNSGSTMLGQNQTELDTTIGTADYDIGHVFSTGGGGIAWLGVPCVDGEKARGVTGLSSPVGDVFDVDFVAHEMGHQFGANHTFNGNAGSCSGGNRNGSTAYEPGSGSTIMAYAGICSPQDVQLNSDAYFHQVSISEIWAYVSSGSGTCASQTATGNSAPTALAGNDYTIPALTPYKLTGSSTDTDGTGTHTFTWEQYDLGSAGLPEETNTTGPLVRTFEGTSDPVRYIPQLSDIIGNGGVSTTWEKLASVSRAINFQLTVRDNDVSGGQTDSDAMVVTVDDSAGPFTVTSQSTTGITWIPGATETITWDVANTDMGSVNTANVNILLSTDGGVNFDTVLLANTPNDGSQDITVPNIPASNCRIMVEGAGNIFFAVNSESFALGVATTCTQYASAENLNLAIDDGVGANMQGTPLFHMINVPDSDIIDSVAINADITHTYIQDLVIQIQHPDGSTFTNVWSRECANENDLDVRFEDGAPSIVCAEPTVGTYAPSLALSAFNSLNSAGNWSIVVVDFFNGDVGTLNDWYVEICTTVTLQASDMQPFSGLSVYPNPNSGNFTVEFNTVSTDDIDIAVFDIQGRRVFESRYEPTVSFKEELRLNNLQSGMYLLSISNGKGSTTRKLIID